MVTLEFPLAYNDYINPYFWPLKPHLCIWALEIEQRRVRVKVEQVWEKCEDWNWFQEFCFPTKILFPNKLVKVSETCKSLLKWLFDKPSCEKPVLTNFSQFFELHETNYEEHNFDRISKNTYPNRMGLVWLWSRSENLSYELKLIFSSFWRNFIDRAWIWGCLAHVH